MKQVYWQRFSKRVGLRMPSPQQVATLLLNNDSKSFCPADTILWLYLYTSPIIISAQAGKPPRNPHRLTSELAKTFKNMNEI